MTREGGFHIDLFDLQATITIDDSGFVNGIKQMTKALKSFSTRPADNLDNSLENLSETVKDVGASFNDVADDSDNLGDSFDDAADKSTKFSDVLKANLLSEVIVNGIKTLANAAKNMAGDFIDAAATVKAETSQFEQTFGDYQTKATEAINRVADASGIMETRLNSAATSIYAFARSSGGAVEESMSLMETALQAAADSAAYYDRSLEDTTETLMSFLKGNYANDAALGVSATETTRNAAAMELFGQKFNDLTEIQKQQTLLKMVTDSQELSGAMGQAAREADGWENVQGNLNETWKQFMAKVGDPVLENLIPIIQDITAAFQEWVSSADWDAFSESFSNFVSSVIDNGSVIISVITGIGAGFVTWGISSLIIGISNIASGAATLAQVFPKVAAAITTVNAAIAANPIGALITLVVTLATAFTTLVLTNEKFRDGFLAVCDAIIAAFQNVADFFSEKIQAIKDGFGGLVDGVKNVLGIHSPSRVFAGIGENMALGLGEGWDDEYSRIKRQIESGMNFGTATVDFVSSGMAQSNRSFANSIISASNEAASQPIKFEISIPLDGQILARKTYTFNQREGQLRGGSLVEVGGT